MEVKKAIGKIFAVATATGLVGATLAGAFAAYDLSTYPAPFVSNGVLSPADSVIVVGANAKTTDVVGAIEIGASLQAAAKTVVPVELGTAVAPTITDGVKIEKSGEKLNYNEDFATVDATLGEEDLPSLLSEKTFKESKGDTDNDVDYSQELQFAVGGNTVVFEQNDDTDVTGTYLAFVDNVPVYTYVVEFDSPYAEYDDTSSTTAKADFEGSVIELQGNKYTITDVKLDTGVVDEMTLLAGETVKWLTQDQPLTVGDHTVMVVNVDENADRCGVEVDGTLKWIDTGDTEEFGEMTIGVLDAIAVHSKDYDQDTCEISIGSQEITLTEGSEVEVNGAEIDGSDVAFTTVSGELQGFEISYTPEDDMWLAPGSEWNDPVFNNFKVAFEEMTKVTENFAFDGGQSAGSFTFKNIEGDTVELPYVEDDGETEVVLGEEHAEEFADATFYNTSDDTLSRTMLFENDEYCTGDTEVEECEGMMLLAVSTGKEARVLKITDINTDDDKVTIKDVTKDKTIEDDYDDGVSSTIDVGFMNIDLIIDETAMTVTADLIDDATGLMETYKSAYVVLSNDGLNVAVQEDKASTADGGTTLSFGVVLGGEDSDAVASTTVSGVTLEDCADDSDDQCGATEWGTTVVYDAENEDAIDFSYPEEQAYANVFVAPLSARVVAGGSGNGFDTEKVNKIPVGLAVLDTQAGAMTKNMIVVGGPCINTVADELENPTGECFAGYEAGKAKIKSFDRKGKVAVLVAGMDAQDTLGASYVLRDYEDYDNKLKGSEVEVVVASLSDITVTSVSQ